MRLSKKFLLIWWPLAWGIIFNYEVSGEVLWENYLNNQSDVVQQKVTEHSASGFIIWQGKAFDSVNSALIRYSYLAQFPTTGDVLPDSVAFNTNTGELTVNVPKALDYEKTPLGEYGAAVILKITAYTDTWDRTSSPSPESTYKHHDVILYIYIEDAPEPIHMTNVPTTITIAEDICLDEFGPGYCWVKIFHVLYEDDDLPTVDIAWLSLVMTDPYTDIFDMSDGDGSVWVYGPYLDYTVTSRYELYIMAEDDTYTENATLVVQLSDVNFPPSFLNLDNSVTTSESAAIGTEIFTVTYADRDKDVMTFSVLGDEHFSIDKKAGVVKVASTLDYETSTSHTVSIKMSDGFYAKTATLTVTITDVDEPPVFNVTSQTMSVNEEYAIGHTLSFFFKATDPETQLEPSDYQLTVDPEGAFIMSSSPFCIMVTQHIDRENETIPLTYILEITAADQGGLESTLSLVINIEDINDNEPVFDQKVYEIEITRDTIVGTSVGKVLATDDDAGPNAEISYSIVPTTGSGLCDVDPKGIITLVNKPDQYEQETISLTVLATDGGSPAKTGSASLVVTLTGKEPVPWIKTPAGIGIITAAIVAFLALIGGIIYGILRRKATRTKERKIKVAPEPRTKMAEKGNQAHSVEQGPSNQASTATVGQQAQKTMPHAGTNSWLRYLSRTPSLYRADAEPNAELMGVNGVPTSLVDPAAEYFRTMKYISGTKMM